jgi:hypothetical protein
MDRASSQSPKTAPALIQASHARAWSIGPAQCHYTFTAALDAKRREFLGRQKIQEAHLTVKEKAQAQPISP